MRSFIAALRSVQSAKRYQQDAPKRRAAEREVAKAAERIAEQAAKRRRR